MKKFLFAYLRLFWGLFLCGLGIVCMIHADVGLAPWDVFHQGLSLRFGITMGVASILVGLVIVIIDFVLREKVGIGTIINMVFIGVVVDFLMIYHLVPIFDQLLLQYIMLFFGMFMMALGMFFYIGAGLGSGPRDGLMVALHKRTGKSIRFCRNSLEIFALIVGFVMGGHIGIGTVVTSFGMGYVTQFVFRLVKFEVKDVKHQYVDEVIWTWIQKKKAKAS